MPYESRYKPEDVLEQPFIGREHSSGTYEELFNNLRHHGVDPDNLNVVMELGDAEAVQMAVEKGVGITFISEMMAARSLARRAGANIAASGTAVNDARAVAAALRGPAVVAGVAGQEQADPRLSPRGAAPRRRRAPRD